MWFDSARKKKGGRALIQAEDDGAKDCEFDGNEGPQPESQRPRESPGSCNQGLSPFFPYPPGTLAMAQRGSIRFTEQYDVHSDFDITVAIQTKASLQKWFSSHGHPIFWRGKGLCPSPDFSWLCPAHEFACTNSLSSPYAPKSFFPGVRACARAHTHTHTHTHTTLWNWVPKKTETQASFLCAVPTRSKSCLPLLINSVSLRQESMLFLWLSRTHTHTHPLPEMFRLSAHDQ